MESIEQFLEQDIPFFLDNFANNQKKSAAEEDEINSLLKPTDKIKSNKQEKTKEPTKTIKTENINVIVEKKIIKQDENQENNKKENDNNLETKNLEINPLNNNKINSQDKKAEHEETSIKNKEKITKINEKNKAKEIILDQKKIDKIIEESATRLDVKPSIDDYVKALIAYEKKDKELAVALFYSLAKKHPRNISILTRLKDSLKLKGPEIKLPKINIKQTKDMMNQQKHETEKTETKKIIIKTEIKEEKETQTNITNSLEQYVEGMEAIKKHEKEKAIKIFNELVKKHPKNISFKLKLQKALKM